MTDDRGDDYKIGYGKPPRSTQFKNGQSGHPTGRPRRKKKAEIAFPALDPTHKFILEEAKRTVNVREGNKAHAIPTTQAVMRALGVKAMQGGVLAMRTFLEYQIRLDAIEHAKRQENFDYWRAHVSDARVKFAIAAGQGESEPEILPHPDDVVLEYATLSVRIVGPCDEEERARCLRLKAELNLYYELMIFCRESDGGMPTEDRPIYGGFTLLFTTLVPHLPPRLRGISQDCHDEILMRAIGPYREWVGHLQARLKEFGLDIDPRKLKPRFIDLRDLNLRFVGGELEEYRWPKHKRTVEPSL